MRDYISREALRLRNRYKTDDPFIISRELNICIRHEPLGALKGFYCIMNRSRFIVINDSLSAHDMRIVCAHELGHDRLHRKLAAAAPFRDISLYDMRSKPEYQANMFAAELLISDGDVLRLTGDEADFFDMCRALEIAPDLLAFKLYAMVGRGYALNVPGNLNSRFLFTKK